MKNKLFAIIAALSMVFALASCELITGILGGGSNVKASIRVASSYVTAGTTVYLDGSDSSGGNLSYQWTLDTQPSGSFISLSSPNSPSTYFTPVTAGPYSVRLRVSAGSKSDETVMTITATGVIASTNPNPTPSPNPGYVAVTSVALNQNSLQLNVGASQYISATVYPVNATNQSVTWYSNNTMVATVDNYGHIYAQSPGFASISVTTADGNKTSTCNVSVQGSSLTTNVSLSPYSTYLSSITRNATIYASVTPSGGTSNLTWWSDTPSVATVTGSGTTGYVTAVGNGSAYIYAMANDGSNVQGYAYVSVSGLVSQTSTISISPNTNYLSSVTRNAYLYATVSPSGSSNYLTWWSDTPSVATVDSTGYVTAQGNGTAVIYARANDGSNVQSSAYVYVSNMSVNVTSIALNPNNLNLSQAYSSQYITKTVSPYNATNQSVTWSSSDTNVATVDTNGYVTARANGTAYIYATSTDGTNISGSATVNVTGFTVPMTGLLLSPYSTYLTQATRYAQIYAYPTPTNASNTSLTWWSDTPSVATVDNYGYVTAQGNGIAYIYARSNDGSNIQSYAYVNVSGFAAASVPVSSIAINQYYIYLYQSAPNQSLLYTVYPTNASNKNLTWSSDNQSVVTVDSYGNVTAHANGTAYVYAYATDGSGISTYWYISVSGYPTGGSVGVTVQ